MTYIDYGLDTARKIEIPPIDVIANCKNEGACEGWSIDAFYEVLTSEEGTNALRVSASVQSPMTTAELEASLMYGFGWAFG